jgi:hypothetical protein
MRKGVKVCYYSGPQLIANEQISPRAVGKRGAQGALGEKVKNIFMKGVTITCE